LFNEFDDFLATAVNPTSGITFQVDRDGEGIVYVDAATGAYIGGSAAAATLQMGPGSLHGRMAVSEANGLGFTIDSLGDTLTYFDATAVDYGGVDLASSRLATGDDPRGLTVNDAAGLVYVTNRADQSVTLFSAATVGYAMGTLGASTIPTGVDKLQSVSVDPTLDLAYVSGDGLVLLDATTGAYANGTLENSDYPAFSSNLSALNPTSAILMLTSDTFVYYHDATTGLYVDWGPKLTTQPTGPVPVALELMP
jgi:DNA-binding beta-propeller fold protein YncE